MARKRKKRVEQDRASKAAYEARIDDVLQLILDGAGRRDIIRFASEKTTVQIDKDGKETKPSFPWITKHKLSSRQIDTYIADATEHMVTACKEADKNLIQRHRGRRESLYARAVNSGDLRTALAVIDSLGNLEGVFPTKKLDVTQTGEQTIHLIATDGFYGNADRLASTKAPPPPAASAE